MTSVKDLLELWPSTARLARDTGIDAAAIRMWKHRGKIPAEHFASLVQSARRFGISGITYEALHNLGQNKNAAAA
jgi:hypothetical protein